MEFLFIQHSDDCNDDGGGGAFKPLCNSSFITYSLCCGEKCCAYVQPYVTFCLLLLTLLLLGVTVRVACKHYNAAREREEEVIFDRLRYTVDNPYYMRPPPYGSPLSRSGSLRKHAHAQPG